MIRARFLRSKNFTLISSQIDSLELNYPKINNFNWFTCFNRFAFNQIILYQLNQIKNQF